MSMQCAAPTEGHSVATPAFGKLVDGRSAPNTVTAVARAGRAVRGLGQVLAGMGASTWLLLDIALLLASVHVGYRVFPPPVMQGVPHVALWQALAIFAFALTIASGVFGLCERETLTGRSRIATRLILTTAATAALVYAVVYVLMYATVSRRVTGLALATYALSAGTLRLWGCWAIRSTYRSLLVVGPRALFESFQNAQADGLLSEYRLVGFISAEERRDSQDAPHHLGAIRDLLPVIRHSGVTDVVVGSQVEGSPGVMEWVSRCLRSGCRVTNEATFYEKATGQILVDGITPSWFLFADLKVHCEEHATLKRIMDVVAAGVGLVLTVPFWPLIALAVKLGDGGPVFHTQDRVGQNGGVFRLHKFRTMRQGAENGKSVWAAPDDPRITRVGRFLRKSRLDELPQLYNVLMGRMSIVGPRPERPDIVAELCDKLPYYAERHLVKPGLTGWAQISFHYGASIADAKRKLQFDLYYLKQMSFELDMIILVRTLGTFLRGAC